MNSVMRTDLRPLSSLVSKIASMRLALLILALLPLTGCKVPPVRDVRLQTPIEVADGLETRVLGLGPLVARMSETSLGLQYGWFCEPATARSILSEHLPIAQQDAEKAFRGVFKPLHYQLRQESTSVFEGAAPAALLLGGTVTQLHSNVCFPLSGSKNLDVGDTSLAKGSALVEVDWELYSAADRRVIYRGRTQGSFLAKDSVPGGLATIVLNAFIASMNNLAADPSFHAIAARPLIPAKSSGVGRSI